MSSPSDTAKVDGRPGHYYVTMLRDDGTYLPLLGPLETHQEALDRVRICSLYAGQMDPRATWCAFGTCRVELGAQGAVMQGVLNDRWPLRYAPGSQMVEHEEPFKELASEKDGPVVPEAAVDFLLFKKGHREHLESVVRTLPPDVYLCATAHWALVNAMRTSLVDMETAAGNPIGGLEGWVVREFGRCSLADSFALALWLEHRPGYDWVGDWLYYNLMTRTLRDGQATASFEDMLLEDFKDLMAGRPRKKAGNLDRTPGCLAEGKRPPVKERPPGSKSRRRETEGEPT